jgi:hypothetical protein
MATQTDQREREDSRLEKGWKNDLAKAEEQRDALADALAKAVAYNDHLGRMPMWLEGARAVLATVGR